MSRRGLDSARVVATAARLADAEGLDSVTLARVAKELGVQAPSLYNHVRGREDLLRLVALRALAELADDLQRAAVGRAGPDALRALAHAYRTYANDHPGVYAAIQRAPDPADDALAAAGRRVLDVLLAVLAAWGLEGDRALQRIRVIRAALHGFVALETSGGFGLPLDLDATFELLLDTLLAGLG